MVIFHILKQYFGKFLHKFIFEKIRKLSILPSPPARNATHNVAGGQSSSHKGEEALAGKIVSYTLRSYLEV